MSNETISTAVISIASGMQPRRPRGEIEADLAELDRLSALGRADLIRNCHLDAVIGAFSNPNQATRRRLERELTVIAPDGAVQEERS